MLVNIVASRSIFIRRSGPGSCDVSNDTCPSGWECTQAGGIAVCADPGGCCSTGGKPTSGMALLALGVGFVVVRRRRRRA